MAIFNSSNNTFQTSAKTLFESVVLSNSQGKVVDNEHPLSISTSSESPSVDAFGRHRSSTPYTLAEYHHLYGESIGLLTQTNGLGAAVTLQPSKSSARLSVGTGADEYVIHQSRMYHDYKPGKSQLCLSSFVFGVPRTNTVMRVGYFDDENGVFVQQSGIGGVSIILRSTVSGSIVDQEVVRSNWNADTLDGNSRSGVALDFSKTQLFFCDFQWLGVGRVRVGFVHNGRMIIAHEFYHSNNLTEVYWVKPALPVRAEIRNIGTATGTAYMDQICSTVMSEGGYSEVGEIFSSSSANRTIDANASICSVAIRLKNSFNGMSNRTIVKLLHLDILAETRNLRFDVYRLPSSTNITGGAWVDVSSSSAVQINTTATAYSTTNGQCMDSGYVVASTQGAKSNPGTAELGGPEATRRAFIAQNIDATDSNVWAIVCHNLTSSTDATASCAFQWREIR